METAVVVLASVYLAILLRVVLGYRRSSVEEMKLQRALKDILRREEEDERLREEWSNLS